MKMFHIGRIFFIAMVLSVVAKAGAFLEIFTGSTNEEGTEAGQVSRASATKSSDDSVVVGVFPNGETKEGRYHELSSENCKDAAIAAENNNAALSFSLSSQLCGAHGLEGDCTIYNKCGVPVKTCADFSKEFSMADLKTFQSTGISCDEVGRIDGSSAASNMLHIVPAGRLFIWPGYAVGHSVVLNHIDGTDEDGTGGPVSLTTLSLEPRVFRVENFFTEMERAFLVNTHNDSSKPLLVPSTTGSRENAAKYSKRSSETGFDTNSRIAMRMKRRGFELAAVPEYNEKWADGIQVLRYNVSNAYVSHLDWMSPESMPTIPEGYIYDPRASSDAPTNGRTSQYLHDYDSAAKGTNRFATIFMYLSDVEMGGETVFPLAPPSDNDIVNPGEGSRPIRNLKEATIHVDNYLESLGVSADYPESSWQRNMISDCQSRMSVKARKGTTILFYNQKPDGSVDEKSKHGGCPVLQGQKWAANLWIWNGVRSGYPHVKNGKAADSAVASTNSNDSGDAGDNSGAIQQIAVGGDVTLIVRIHDSGRNAEGKYSLYWQDVEFGDVTRMPLKFNTFEGHKWNIKSKKTGKVVETYTCHREYFDQTWDFLPPESPLYEHAKAYREKKQKKLEQGESKISNEEEVSKDFIKSVDFDQERSLQELATDAIKMATAGRKKAKGARGRTKSNVRGGQDRNADGSVRNPADPARQPRNRAVLPGSTVYTQEAKDLWDTADFSNKSEL